MALSWRAARPVQTPTAETVADGIAVRVPVPEALRTLLEVVDEVVEVSEAEILDATRQLGAMLPLRLETSAAVGWAAALARSRPAGGVALVLTGGNVAP
jgi:threonine dehydratase